MSRPKYQCRSQLQAAALLQMAMGAVLLVVGGLTILGPYLQGAGYQVMLAGGKPQVSTLMLILGSLFISLSYGTFRMRRWARAVSLSFSFILLLGAGLALGLTMLSDAAPSARNADDWAFWAITTVLYFGAPLALLAAYRGPQVRAAFQQLDPSESWTDKISYPVLGAVILYTIIGVEMICIALSFGLGTVPRFFGEQSQPVSCLGWAFFGAVWLWTAIAVVRGIRSAWLLAAALPFSLLLSL